MSTYYYLVCVDCGQKAPAASRIASGDIVHLADSDTVLPSFIYTHRDCNVKIVSEHTYELFDPNYIFTRWDEKNYRKLSGME